MKFGTMKIFALILANCAFFSWTVTGRRLAIPSWVRESGVVVTSTVAARSYRCEMRPLKKPRPGFNAYWFPRTYAYTYLADINKCKRFKFLLLVDFSKNAFATLKECVKMCLKPS